MRIFSAPLITFTALVFLGGILTGCDDNPVSVEDYPIQGNMEAPLEATVNPATTDTVEVTYQGLEQHPKAELPSNINASLLSQDGSPSEGSTRWEISLAGELSQLVSQEPLVVKGNTGDREVADTITVTTTAISVSSTFSSSFIAIADLEDDARTLSTSGGTSAEIINSDDPAGSAPPNTPSGSNGVRYLEATGSADGSVTIERPTNLPNSSFFSFLVRQNSETDFTLTVTLTTSQTTHEVDIPVQAGGDWLKYGMTFADIEEFSENTDAAFNPVASRSGGPGELQSISFSADADVTYGIDEIFFGEGLETPRVAFEDFERPTDAYTDGDCTSPSSDVASQSDGFNSLTVESCGFFGYNYGGAFGPPSLVYLDVDGDDVVSFRAKGETSDEQVDVLIETVDGKGGFGFDSRITVDIPGNSWERVEIPIGDLGDDPSVLKTEGLRNFGFDSAGDFVLDDFKIMPK